MPGFVLTDVSQINDAYLSLTATLTCGATFEIRVRLRKTDEAPSASTNLRECA